MQFCAKCAKNKITQQHVFWLLTIYKINQFSGEINICVYNLLFYCPGLFSIHTCTWGWASIVEQCQLFLAKQSCIFLLQTCYWTWAPVQLCWSLRHAIWIPPHWINSACILAINFGAVKINRFSSLLPKFRCVLMAFNINCWRTHLFIISRS